MKRSGIAFAVLSASLGFTWAQPIRPQPEILSRTPIRIPDIPGYLTLKCDFHTHTVFSDGSVWPGVRSEEAWREGLDAIAITDHIEYQPHKKDLPTNHNRAYDIARRGGEELDLIVIRGSEVTRKMPPGHLNAIFLESSEPLDTEEWRDAAKVAKDQGAFIFWNHPGWTGQQPDGVARWYPEQTELFEKGMLHGIEVVNDRDYYPEVHAWAIDKKLTLLGNSDIHSPVGMDFEIHAGDHRPFTLVFAKERSAEAIKDALFARRTAVYHNSLLIGDEQFLRPIFESSIRVLRPRVSIVGDGNARLQIQNLSDIDYELLIADNSETEGIRIPRRVMLYGGKITRLTVESLSNDRTEEKDYVLRYTVKNLRISPDASLAVEFPITVSFSPEKP